MYIDCTERGWKSYDSRFSFFSFLSRNLWSVYHLPGYEVPGSIGTTLLTISNYLGKGLHGASMELERLPSNRCR